MTRAAIIVVASFFAAPRADEEVPKATPAAPDLPGGVGREGNCEASASGKRQGKIEALEAKFIKNAAAVSALRKIKVFECRHARYTYLNSAAFESAFFTRDPMKTEYRGPSTRCKSDRSVATEVLT